MPQKQHESGSCLQTHKLRGSEAQGIMRAKARPNKCKLQSPNRCHAAEMHSPTLAQTNLCRSQGEPREHTVRTCEVCVHTRPPHTGKKTAQPHEQHHRCVQAASRQRQRGSYTARVDSQVSATANVTGSRRHPPDATNPKANTRRGAACKHTELRGRQAQGMKRARRDPESASCRIPPADMQASKGTARPRTAHRRRNRHACTPAQRN